MELQINPSQPNSFTNKLEEAVKSLIRIENYDPYSHSIHHNFELTDGPKILRVFGTKHFSEPESRLFKAIIDSMEEFRPEMVWVEGLRDIRTGSTPDVRSRYLAEVSKLSREESVKMAEGRLGAKIAQDLGANVYSIEPSLGELFDYHLKAGYSKRDILTSYIDYTLSVAHLYTGQMTPIELANYRLNMIMNECSWGRNELTLDIVERRTRELFNDFPINNTQWFFEKVNCLQKKDHPEYSVLNEISAADTYFRDVAFLERIAASLDRYTKVFVLVGASHAFMQEPALRELFNID